MAEERLEMIDVARRLELSSVVVLRELAGRERPVSTLLEGDDALLEAQLDWLNRKGLIEADSEANYVVTERGEHALDRFSARYRDFVATLDIYCAVDLEAGEFGYAKFFDFENEEDFRAYLELERFSDLRVAVATFKGLDPVEVVFMGAIFDGALEGPDWQSELNDDEFWEEVFAICSTAIRQEELADPGVPGDDGRETLSTIVERGALLNIELRQQEDRLRAQDASAEPRDEDEYTIEEYRQYADPLYVAPVWTGGWFFW